MRTGNRSIVAAAFLYAMLLIQGCSNEGPLFSCEQELRRQTTSPDKQWKAGVVIVECGATTPTATWIVLTRTGVDFDFDPDTVAVFKGEVVDISWEANTLRIRAGEAESFQADSSKGEINIVYR